jgi:predicted NBD/HSP70 family sugar kinase
VFASSNAALRYYREICPNGDAIDIHQLLRKSEEGDPSAIEAVTRQAVFLGRGLRLVTAALSPEEILIAGDITTSWSRIGPIVQTELEKVTLAGTPPRLRTTNDGELSRLRGAAAIVLQRHSGYRRSKPGALDRPRRALHPL